MEKVQNRAARFVTRNYTFEEGSMTGILEQLRWESLKKRRTDNRLILLYKGLKGKARILEYAKFVGLRSQRQLAKSSEKKQSNFLPYQE